MKFLTKKINILIIFIIFLLTGCEVLQTNSSTLLDYTKTYAGSIPCEDCDEQRINLSLTKDKTYDKSIDYIGKSDETAFEKGNWTLKNNILTLFTGKEIENKESYKVTKKGLKLYTQNGQRIISTEDYILTPN